MAKATVGNEQGWTIGAFPAQVLLRRGATQDTFSPLAKKWRTQYDSNVRPLPSEGSALSTELWVLSRARNLAKGGGLRKWRGFGGVTRGAGLRY
jgi:hypothetical protein